MEVIRTADGSHTVVHPEWNTLYHSRHGAIQESRHVFVEQGLDQLPKDLDAVSVFEMGFGTGLNALLSLEWAMHRKKQLRYAAIDNHPLPKEVWSQLRYADSMGGKVQEDHLLTMHEVPWDKPHTLQPGVDLLKVSGSILSLPTLAAFYSPYDIVFYDAFAPTTQPELWKHPVFLVLYKMLKSDGLLVTYCAQGAFRRELKAAGFDVYKRPGPAFKREMTFAVRQ